MSLFRFSPTPSGYLHIGNAFNFVLTWLIAREKGARILLRIDDLDAVRRRDEYVEDIFRSIDRLGLDYDEGPGGPDDFYANWSQQHRLPLYEAALQNLAKLPEVYACGLSRKQINQLKAKGQYPDAARRQALSLEMPDTAWRIQTSPTHDISFQDMTGDRHQVNLHAQMCDFVIRRKEGLPAYQLASLVDDQHFGVTGIVRGRDLLPSTAAQLFLAEKIAMEDFGQIEFLHHPLFVKGKGEKLSKSAGAVSLKEMLKKPEEVFSFLSQALGMEKGRSLQDLQAGFQIKSLIMKGIQI